MINEESLSNDYVLHNKKDEEFQGRLFIDEEYNGNIAIKLVDLQALSNSFINFLCFF